MESKGKISFGFKKAGGGIGGTATGAGHPPSSLGKPKAKTGSAFGESDGEEEDGGGQGWEKGSGSKGGGKRAGEGARSMRVGGAAPQSRSAKQRTDEAIKVDASVFDYDGVYDSMKVAEREGAMKREEEKKRRDPKYITTALATSEQRKIDRSRAEAKMIQRERDAEGEEYKDTESFVTDSYKKQMEEIRQAEEKEKIEEETNRRKSKGVAGFYKNFMEETDRAHQAAVSASLDPQHSARVAAAGKGEGEEEVQKGEQGKKKAVEEARKKGLDVRVNDDNEVVDERSLLSAGLNMFGKKKARDGEEGRGQGAGRDRGLRGENGKRDGAREAREAREAQRERTSRMFEEQMLEMEEKREEEEREEEEREEERKRVLVKEREREDGLERKRKREEGSGT